VFVLHGIFAQGRHSVVTEPLPQLEFVGNRHAFHRVLDFRRVAELIRFEVKLAGARIGNRAPRRSARES
jgi:hypothetical protein